MSSKYSTITNNVNMLLIDSSTIKNFSPYVAYISSVNVPGRIATIRDSTGLLSTPGRIIIVSTLKDVLFADGTSSIRITQPFGYITMSARDKNTWSIVNTFAFPNPEGNTNVSSIYSAGTINCDSLVTRSYVSTVSLNTNSIALETNSIYSGISQYARDLYAKNNVDPPIILTPPFSYTGFVTSSGLYSPIVDVYVDPNSPVLVNSYTFTSPVTGYLTFHISYNWLGDSPLNRNMIGSLYENGLLIDTQYTTINESTNVNASSYATFRRVYDHANEQRIYEQYISCEISPTGFGDTKCRPSWTIYFTPFDI